MSVTPLSHSARPCTADCWRTVEPESAKFQFAAVPAVTQLAPAGVVVLDLPAAASSGVTYCASPKKRTPAVVSTSVRRNSSRRAVEPAQVGFAGGYVNTPV